MVNFDKSLFIAFIFMFALGFVFGLYIGTASLEQDNRNAIANGCAQYNSKTGKFEWLKQ